MMTPEDIAMHNRNYEGLVTYITGLADIVIDIKIQLDRIEKQMETLKK